MAKIKTEILGVKINNLSQKEVLEKIEKILKGDKQRYLVLPYSEFVVRANQDQEFREIINQADLSLCEGKGLFFAMKFLNQPLKERIAGVELVEEICRRFREIFLFGGKPEVVLKVREKFKNNIAGFSDGYQKDEAVIEKINQIGPKILIAALGSPKQEKWIVENLPKIPSVKLALGVGGAFDFISGKRKRAPRALREAGLEWLWRFFREPWRAKRILKAVVVFPWLVIKEKLSTRK